MSDRRAARRAREQAQREARAAMKARRAAVKAKLAEARARRRDDPAARRRRLRRKLLLLALLLLLLLLRRCECETPVEGPPADAAVDAAVVVADMGPDAAPPAKKKKKAAPKPPIRARIGRKERPEFRNPTPPPADWLVALRIQVAARGPRLARCFEGTDRPGALEWTAVVDVERGVVSDHGFEPVLDGAQLSKALERCLIGVLSAPPYRLPAAPDAGRPRVSIIVEF